MRKLAIVRTWRTEKPTSFPIRYKGNCAAASLLFPTGASNTHSEAQRLSWNVQARVNYRSESIEDKIFSEFSLKLS
jgi:hypothetical protein